jgi:hypothetical protein
LASYLLFSLILCFPYCYDTYLLMTLSLLIGEARNATTFFFTMDQLAGSQDLEIFPQSVTSFIFYFYSLANWLLLISWEISYLFTLCLLSSLRNLLPTIMILKP